jgi:plasmid stabilization system protein ParE
MFERELDGVLERLGAAPDMGSPYRSDDFRVLVRRVLMPKTGNHVYYALDGDDVVVLSIWGARRGHGPGL